MSSEPRTIADRISDSDVVMSSSGENCRRKHKNVSERKRRWPNHLKIHMPLVKTNLASPLRWNIKRIFMLKLAWRKNYQSSSKIPACSFLGEKLLRCLVIVVLLQGCRSQPQANLPAELIGTWTTNHPKYAGLYFQVNPGSFAFSTPEGAVEAYTLTKYEPVESTVKRRKMITHVLHGTRPDQETHLSLTYDPAGGGTIRLSNRANMVWTRQNGPPQ